MSHAIMVPPPGYKFIPRSAKICNNAGCFECFDIYCERCESKDRRIIELEMRNNDLVKHITLLQGQLFPRANKKESREEGNPSSSSFATVTSPIMYDPNLNMNYVATTQFKPA